MGEESLNYQYNCRLRGNNKHRGRHKNKSKLSGSVTACLFLICPQPASNVIALKIMIDFFIG